MKLAAVTTLIYALLVLAGGIFGYSQARSLPSLISGVVFGLILLLMGYLIWQGSVAGVYATVAIVLFLALFFAYRFTATGRIMPGGAMFALSFVTVVLLVFGAFSSLRE
jgi:uncharacterized membrane protein (UPF0136 family)